MSDPDREDFHSWALPEVFVECPVQGAARHSSGCRHFRDSNVAFLVMLKNILNCAGTFWIVHRKNIRAYTRDDALGWNKDGFAGTGFAIQDLIKQLGSFITDSLQIIIDT